jgi:hypothetical protein
LIGQGPSISVAVIVCRISAIAIAYSRSINALTSTWGLFRIVSTSPASVASI